MSVVIADNRAFAAACIEVMREVEGRDFRFLLSTGARAVTVPVGVLHLARERLEKADARA